MAMAPAQQQTLQQQLNDLAGSSDAGLDAQALSWASGYLAGLAVARVGLDMALLPATAPAASPQATLNIWYGSETGNGRGVAERLARAAEAAGHMVTLAATDDIQPRSISKLSHLLLVVSTHGEGEPPETAAALHQYLLSERAPQLPQLAYAVFALGDSSYPDFCQTGRELDQRLAELGASRLLQRVDVDVDFAPAEESWREQVLVSVADLLPDAAQAATPTPAPSAVCGAAAVHLQLVTGNAPESAHDRNNPWLAEVLESAPLTVAPSTAVVKHVALDAAALSYQPGDAVGIWPQHDERLVDEILQLTGLDGAAVVAHRDHSLPLSQWLRERLELTQLTRPFLQAWAECGEFAELSGLLDDREALTAWQSSRQVVDVLRDYPGDVSADELVGMLRGLTPRLYSIASSPLLFEDELHLTVKQVGGLNGEQRLRAGVASWQLAQQLAPGDSVPVYIESNPRFRLPQDSARDIIMVGPGTGVAPFRAFVQQRHALQASGRNWLFFGARHRRTDFLYQLEWQRFQRQGALHELSVAFSRDHSERIYVQQRLLEQGREVFDWLENGAHFYVCGDGQRMAKDVHQALLQIIARHGGLSNEQAAAYLQQMQSDQRYQKDVY
ncbi:MAG: assimilatory sulfite reductase (NADPH) flavoprotein subunit [Wenzhouxiangellaceae bacterium]